MKRIVLLGLGIVTALLAAVATGCGSPQVRPDREQIQRRSDKSFHELEREEERLQDE